MKPREKSLLVVNDFPPILGGQSAYYYNLCLGVPPANILVLAPTWQGCEEFDAKQTFSIIRRKYLSKLPIVEKAAKIILPFFHTLRIIEKEEIKYIHCAHVLSTGVMGLALKKLIGKNYVVYIHSADVLEHGEKPLIRNLLLLILKNASHIVANSGFSKLILMDLGIGENKIIKVNPRIDFTYYDEEKDTSGVRKKYGLAGKKIILSVNRLIERKGNDVVIEAMESIKNKIPNAKHLIVGDGPYKGRLEELIEEKGLGEDVTILSSLDNREIGELYKVCDVFAMISREIKEKGDAEGFGMVFLEANASGKPVVGGDSGGVRDAVVDGETGILVNPTDANQVAEALVRILSNEKLAHELGTKGRRRVERDFDSMKGFPELAFLF